MPNKYLSATVLGILIWSTSFVGTKMAFASFPPLTLGALRFVVASLLLGGIVLLRRQFVLPAKGDLGLLALSGFLGITLYFAMENVGVSMTSASNAALIVASYPAITILLERMIYGTRISRLKCFGIAIAIVGVYIISREAGSEGGGDRRLLGNIILIATGIVWAFYNFATRKVVNKYSGVTVSFYQTVAGTAFFLPFCLLETDQWAKPTAASLLVLVYLGIFCSVAGFMLYNYGLRQLPVATAITLLNLVPVFGVLFSVLILGEEIRADRLAGGVLVIVGVLISVRAASK